MCRNTFPVFMLDFLCIEIQDLIWTFSPLCNYRLFQEDTFYFLHYRVNFPQHSFYSLNLIFVDIKNLLCHWVISILKGFCTDSMMEKSECKWKVKASRFLEILLLSCKGIINKKRKYYFQLFISYSYIYLPNTEIF